MFVPTLCQRQPEREIERERETERERQRETERDRETVNVVLGFF